MTSLALFKWHHQTYHLRRQLLQIEASLLLFPAELHVYAVKKQVPLVELPLLKQRKEMKFRYVSIQYYHSITAIDTIMGRAILTCTHRQILTMFPPTCSIRLPFNSSQLSKVWVDRSSLYSFCLRASQTQRSLSLVNDQSCIPRARSLPNTYAVFSILASKFCVLKAPEASQQL